MIAFDLFAGAGGASLGLIGAAQDLGIRVDGLRAVNHWGPAIEVHRANHPWADHYQEDVRRLCPRSIVGKERPRLGLAGPDCTHHSNARGGKPRDTGQRALAWDVVRWARLTEPHALLIENVPEFTSWGPLTADGKRDKDRSGEYFNEFLSALCRLGYSVDWRIFCAADYGDATSRRRFFLQARADGRVTWPEPTHTPDPAGNLFGGERHRPAREIIDWNQPGQSIFSRRKPLADKTMRRIIEGVKRFAAEPFLLGVGGPTGRQSARGVGEPLPTVLGVNTTYLCTPFVLPQLSCGRPRSVEEPLCTITATGTGNALCVPFLTAAYGERPGQLARVHSIDAPLPTATGENRFGLVQPFLVSYYGNGQPIAIDSPLPTATGRDRFGLVEPITARDGSRWVVADILFRMLQPEELAAAHSFPADYDWSPARTKTNRVRLVGNSWPVRMGEALCRSILENQR
jgi:DNA (cytosine-5)-methyltransferase 1